ncbi:SDR family NAD(P)-dependent oxidoreductase [Chloroflexota bacterium]
MRKLDKKVAVITGSARGIGKQIALTFASEGANIVVSDVRTEEMEATAKEIKDLGRKVINVKADVSKKEEVKKLIDTTIDNFNKVDILVNNAGITRQASLLEMTEDEWDDVLDVNLKGVFLCTQAAAKYMIEKKYGKIISIASVDGLGGTKLRAANYAASKAGVIQLTKSYARELGTYGININAIAPGLVVTDFISTGRTPKQVEQLLEERRKLALLGRLGFPQDIANVALFLASDDSSYITGQVIVSDGGRPDRM